MSGSASYDRTQRRAVPARWPASSRWARPANGSVQIWSASLMYAGSRHDQTIHAGSLFSVRGSRPDQIAVYAYA